MTPLVLCFTWPGKNKVEASRNWPAHYILWDMAHIDDAQRGLKTIIREQMAESWDHYTLRGVKGFALYVKIKGRVKRRRLFVPATDVEIVERYLTEGTFLPHTVLSELEEIRD